MSRQQQTIHAAVLHGIGQAPRYERFPAPVPGEGQAVVSVTAAALKPSDRLMANGVHYAPTRFPQIVGLDGVGRLSDGTRVAFFAPQPPYGGMAEQALVRRGVWLPVPDGIDDVIAAAVTNPGMAAWKTLFWEGQLTPDRPCSCSVPPARRAGSPRSWQRATAPASSPPGATSVSSTSSWRAERTPRSGSTAHATSWPWRSPPRDRTT